MRAIRALCPILAVALLVAAAPACAHAQEGGRLLSLDETVGMLAVAAEGPGEFLWDPFLQEGSFAVAGHRGAFMAALSPGQSGFLVLNGTEVYTVPLPFLSGGELFFPEGFASVAAGAFSRLARGSFHYRIAAIVIDPGHGGRDPGAVFHHTIGGERRLVRESDIVLNASRMLRDMLVARFPDKRVLMTRERDIFPSLEERSLLANSIPVRDNEAVIFVSIHANYATNRNARGFEVWHLTPTYRRQLVDEERFPDPELRRILNMLTEESFRTESVFIAQSILDGLQETVGDRMPNRGLKAENWFVVRRSNMPAVLVELGFVSNARDAAMMTDEASLREIVEGVFRGLAGFIDAFERSGGFIVAQ